MNKALIHGGAAEAERLAELIRHPLSLRVAANTYLNAVLTSVFFSAFFLYAGYPYVGGVLLAIGLLAFPVLYLTDRIVFDGRRLIRTGLIPRIWSRIDGSPTSLDIDEVEQVETQSLRALRRGGSVLYRYRTIITGDSVRFVLASGGEKYRKMIKSLLPMFSRNLLDNRSIELRDYINEPKETQMKAEFAKVPSEDVLEDSIRDFDTLRKSRGKRPEFGDPDFEKADYLRTLANELRLSGYLLQSLEVFRRALFLNPKDAWLLFEFARALHSFAGAERDSRLERRALAVLRLAEIRAGNDRELLSRVGESYFQYGEWNRAARTFRRAAAKAEESFRSLRGLAEIALREGKIAHVIHHFYAAHRAAELPSLRRWTQSEAEYFSMLNEDEEYLEMEIGRIGMLEKIENARRTTRRIIATSVAVLLGAFLFDIELLVNVGWAVSAVAVLIETGLTISRGLLGERVPALEN